MATAGKTAAGQNLYVSDPQAYRDRLYGLLGEQNPLDVMEQTAAALAEIARRHSAELLRARLFEGKWTANEVIGHLADGELVYGYRMRLILSEDDPPLIGTNQDQWVVRQRHNEREPAEHVQAFAALRALNLAVWKHLSPADLARAGRHNERGAESLAVMLRLTAGHDLSHLAQIRRHIEAASERLSH